MFEVPQNLVLQQQLHVIEVQMKAGLIPSMSVAIMCIYLFADKVDSSLLIIWGSCTLLNGLANWLYLYWSQNNPNDNLVEIKKRLYVITAMGFVAGCLWGVATLLLLQPQFGDESFLVQFIFLTLAITGISAGALGSNAPYLPAYYFFVLPFMLPMLFILLFVYSESELQAIGIIDFFYIIAIFRFAHEVNKNLRESIRLTHQNKFLAEEYRVEKEHAEKSDLAKSRFLASASHDLRQPLHALGFYSDALQDDTPRDMQKKLIAGIHQTTNSLRAMLDVILDLSKIQSKTLKLDFTPVVISQVLSDIERSFSQQCQDKNITLNIVASSAVVQSDITAVTRILMNLVSNAIRYTESGGRVLVGIRRHGTSSVTLQVWDNGVGISDQDQKQIFEEYFQVSNSERDSQQGLGLGLSIVKGLAVSINSEVKVRSRLAFGSCFSIDLPLVEQQTITLKQYQVAPKLDEINAQHQAMNIILLDDDVNILDAVSLLLCQWGYQVRCAENYAQVLAILVEGFQPQVIISDYRLRDGVTGIEVLDKLQQSSDNDFSAILITGDTAPERLIEAQASGYKLLHKPIKPLKLRSALSIIQARQSELI